MQRYSLFKLPLLLFQLSEKSAFQLRTFSATILSIRIRPLFHINRYNLTRRGIILYLEYQSVCPVSIRLNWSETKGGGGATLACGWGGGGANSDDWRESLALCLLCALTPIDLEDFFYLFWQNLFLKKSLSPFEISCSWPPSLYRLRRRQYLWYILAIALTHLSWSGAGDYKEM
jgi:hypothetical protein